MTKIKQFEKKAEQKAQEDQNKEVTFTPVEATDSVLEDPSLVLDKTEEFLKKNQKWVLAGLVTLVVAVGGYFGFRYYKSEQQNEAATKLYAAEHFFQMDSLGKVAKGEGKYLSAKKVGDSYDITQTGKLAHLYAGIALMKENKFKEAITQLEGFSSDDKIIQGRTYALIGDANMELNKLDDAITNYRKAANYYPNQFFTPTYLIKLALAYELKNDTKAAIGVYDELIKDYYNSSERMNAQKYKARLEASLETK